MTDTGSTTPTSTDPSGAGVPATQNPIIEGLIDELPPQHTPWSWKKRLAWIECFEAATHLIWHGTKRLHVSTTPPPAPTPTPAPANDDDDDDDGDTVPSTTTANPAPAAAAA